MIDRIYKILEVILNKENRGNIKVPDFESMLYNTIIDLYEEKLFELNRAVNRGNKGLIEGGYADIREDLRERIVYYLVPTTINKNAGLFSLPSDYKKIDAVFISNTNRRIEVCKDSSIYYTTQEYQNTRPSLTYPIALKIGNKVEVKPDDVANIKLYYLRLPKYPKWTFEVVNGVPLFDSSSNGFQDVDAHPSEESQIITRLLEKSGVNLGNYDVAKIAQQLKVEEYQKENNI